MMEALVPPAILLRNDHQQDNNNNNNSDDDDDDDTLNVRLDCTKTPDDTSSSSTENNEDWVANARGANVLWDTAATAAAASRNDTVYQKLLPNPESTNTVDNDQCILRLRVFRNASEGWIQHYVLAPAGGGTVPDLGSIFRSISTPAGNVKQLELSSSSSNSSSSCGTSRTRLCPVSGPVLAEFLRANRGHLEYLQFTKFTLHPAHFQALRTTTDAVAVAAGKNDDGTTTATHVLLQVELNECKARVSRLC